jgi:hypothetical protein
MAPKINDRRSSNKVTPRAERAIFRRAISGAFTLCSSLIQSEERHGRIESRFRRCRGFALGLTGGGGSIFAVPMLVYGLAVAPREAIGISLAAVGATALVGALQRLQAGEVELGTGVFFAVAGMVGAPDVAHGVSGHSPASAGAVV